VPGLSTASRQYTSGPYSIATAPRAGVQSRVGDGEARLERQYQDHLVASCHSWLTAHHPSVGAVSTGVPLTVNVGCSAQCGTPHAPAPTDRPALRAAGW
jgi:hypothetical protein